MAFSLSSLKPAVRAEYVKAQSAPILWPVVIKAAAANGQSQVDLLTNIVFFLHHPELNFRSIKPHEQTLIDQWKTFRSMVITMVPNVILSTVVDKPEEKPAIEPSGELPVRVTAWEMERNKVRWLQPSSGVLNGILLKQGMRFDAVDGRRTILHVTTVAETYGDVIFARDPVKAGFWNGNGQAPGSGGGVFRQKARAFVSDGTFGEVAKVLGRSEQMMVIARVEMTLVMGFLCAAMGATVAAVKTGYDIAEKLAWIAANRKKIEAWATALWALHKASYQMENLTPVFHDFIRTAILKIVVKRIPTAVANDKDFIYQALADAIGGLGEAALTSAMKVMKEVLKLALEIMKSAFVEAAKLTAEQLEADADKIIAEVRKQNVHLTKPQAKEMRLEWANHRATLQAIFEELSEKFRAAAEA